MKYLQIIVIAVLFTACSGAKKVTNKTTPVTPLPKTTNVPVAAKTTQKEALKTTTDASLKVVKQNKIEPVKEVIEKKEVLKATENTVTPVKPTVTTFPKVTTPGVKAPEVVTPKPIKKQNLNHSSWHALLQKHVSNQGQVNYKGFKKDNRLLQDYIKLLGDNMPPSSASKNEKLVYWINAYNALTIDLILRHYPVASIKDIKDPWGKRFWKLGGKWRDLNEIEHQILRKMNEPRVHFAIVCASFSCPKLVNKAFVAHGLDAQLTTATRDFIADPKRNSISANAIQVSKIFQWFSKDFKQNGGDVLDFINKYSDIKISKNANKDVKDYNWALNE